MGVFFAIAHANMIKIESSAGVANKTWSQTVFALLRYLEFFLFIFIPSNVSKV